MSPARPGREARRAAGRLCLLDFPGTTPPARLERLIATHHIAGVVLFRKNVAGAEQVAGLTASLGRIAHEAGAPSPWIAIDHEGGAVNRFAHASAAPAVTPLPGAMAVGAAGDPALAREAGAVAGRELRAMGVHLNFAPVVDVNSNPANPVIGARAFGEAPETVGSLGAALIEALQAAGVAATAKHFPGHGDAALDSHLALPLVDHPRTRLEAVELPPFAAALRAGAAAVMTAHVAFPSLDPRGHPATLSAPLLTGLLRDAWGFEGIVCSDSLGMRAITDHYGAGEAAVTAVLAGCDLLLALGPDALQDEVLERLAAAIAAGVLDGAHLARAFARLDAARARWVRVAPPGGLDETVGAAEHVASARRIAEAAVTLVRDRLGVLPSRGGRIGVVAAGGEAADAAGGLVAALRRCHARVEPVVAGGPPGPVDRIVAVTHSRGMPSAEAAATVGALCAQEEARLIVVATGDPYDLTACPDAPAFVATYGADPFSLDAAAGILLGLIPPRGRLPVTLPGLYPVGHGVVG